MALLGNVCDLILSINRFEMPYNIWCGGCGIHIGMGMSIIEKLNK